jgi:perosamine synthetase
MTTTHFAPVTSPARSWQPVARQGLRWLPPVHSPLSLSVLGRAAQCAIGMGGDPRAHLAEWLRAEYHAARAVLVDSGTHALEIALRVALGLVDEAPVVALPAYTCFDMATAAVGAGARIALYDIDPNSLAPDLDSLRDAFAHGARVVVVSPLYGVPLDWRGIDHCAREFGAFVIEDAAQGHGMMWQNCPVGSHAQLSVLSFGRGKGWTGGCGGALLARGGATGWLEELTVERAVAPSVVDTLVHAGAQWALGRPELFALPASIPWLHLGETRYHTPTPIRDMPRVAAAMLLASHGLAAREMEIRRANAAALQARIVGMPHVRGVTAVSGSVPGHLRFPVRLARGVDGFGDARLAARLGITPGYPSTLAALPAVQDQLNPIPGSAGCRGAEELVRTLVTLPTHSLVTPADREAILNMLGAYAA